MKNAIRMPFGKHRGEAIEDLPNGYLIWLTTKAEIHDSELRAAIEAEGNARLADGRLRPEEIQ